MAGNAAGLGYVPLTMSEQSAQNKQMRQMGLSSEPIVPRGRITPAADPTPAAPPPAASRFGDALTGGRSEIAENLSGLGEWAGTDLLDPLADQIAPGEDALARSDQRDQNRAAAVEAGDRSAAAAYVGDIMDLAAGEVLPMATTIGVAGAAGKTVGTAAAKAGIKGPLGTALKWSGRLIGAAATEMGLLRNESLRAAGYEPGDPNIPQDVNDNATVAAFAKSALENVTPLKFLNRLFPGKANRIVKEGWDRAKSVGGAVVGDGAAEVLTEMAQPALDELIMTPGAFEKLTEAEIADIKPYLSERFGSWEKAKEYIAAGFVGGTSGAISQTAEDMNTARRAADAEKMARSLEPLGMTTDRAAEVIAEKGGIEKIQAAVPEIGQAETVYRVGMQELDKALAQGTDPAEVDAARAELKRVRDAAVDKNAKALGLPLRVADVERQEADLKKDKLEADEGRLRQYGVKPSDTARAYGEAIGETADTLDRLSDEISTLDARVRATANPERKAETQAELDEARINYRTSMISAKMKLEDKTREQAEKEVSGRDRAEKQAAKREAAIEKQLESEFTDSMSDEDKLAKAEQLVASYEDNPSEDEKNLRKKIRRLEGQRRKATNPETIDSLNEDIAELEARQGLPTPAVEAARRVLQDLGPQTSTAETGASRPEDQPTLAAAKDTVEGGVVPKPETGAEAAAAPSAESADATPVVNERSRQLEVSKGVRKAQGKKSLDIAPNVSEATRLTLVKQAQAIRTAKTPNEAKERKFGKDMVEAGYTDRRTKDETPDYAAIGREAAVALTYATNEEAGISNEGLRTEGNVAAEDDPRRAGYDDVYEWDDLLDYVGQDATLESVEADLAEWTKRSKKEASAHFAADGTLLGVGTSNLRNGVMPPVQGFGDPTVTFTHTHPVFTPFSNQDVRAMMTHGGPFRAIMPDGSVTAMKPKKPMTRSRAKLTAMQKVLIDTVDKHLPADTPTNVKDVVRQETLLQYLEGEGFIEYTTPFANLTKTEEDYVATILEEADAGLRREQNVRAGTAADRADGGRDGSAAARGPEKLTTPGARAKRDARTVANRDRIRDVADAIYDYYAKGIPGERSPRALRRAIKSGVTRAQVRQATKVAISGVGNKSNFVLRDVAYALYPELRTDVAATFYLGKSSRAVDQKGQRQYETTDEAQKKFNAALNLMEAVAQSSDDKMFLYHDPRYVKQSKSNRRFRAYILEMNSALKKQLEYTGSPQSSLMPPMENPDDTSQIVKNKDMRLTDEQQEPGRRTARYFQRNTYTVDLKQLAKLEPEDLISGKGAAGKGITKSDDIPEWRRISSELNAGVALEDLPDADQTFFKSKGFLISDQMRTAERKLARFRESVEEHQRLYPGEPVGFQYQIDNKGRIYADGDLNPQTSDAVKKMFMVDGVSLGDMTTVDASASGWQVAALIARDEVLAPQVNLGAGQATIPGFQKQDMYMATIANIERQVAEDANRTGTLTKPQREAKKLAQIAQKDLLDKGLLTRNTIKTPVIAVNYAASTKNFTDHFGKAFAPVYPNGKLPKGLAGYLGRTARAGLEVAAPHTMRMQDWAVDTITKVTKAVEKGGIDTQPQNTWTVGSNGTYQRLKFSQKEAMIRFRSAPFRRYKEKEEAGQIGFIKDDNGDPIFDHIDKKDGHISDTTTPINTGEVDAGATARSVYSQIIQGFDASILHEAVELYKQDTDGGFITTNHDAFTAPKELTPKAAEAARVAMHKVMKDAGNVPMRIYNDAVRNLEAAGLTPEDAGITMPPAQGNYNIDDVLTSTPVFAEDANGNDYVPEYGTLEKAPAPTVNADRTPELAAAVDVAQYMEQPEDRSYYSQVQSWAGGGTGAILNKMARSVETGLANGLAPLKHAEKKIRGDGTLATGMDSAFKNAEMAINDSGRNESLLYYGAGKRGQFGQYEVAPGTVGIKEILKTASGGARNGQQLQHWSEWMAARRAQELNARGIKTPQTAADIQTALARHRPEFDTAADMWNAHNKANLQLAKDTGLISQAQMDAMAADAFYVPFYRADQRVDGTSPSFDMPSIGSSGKHITARDPGIKKMKGGDKMRIANIPMNMLKNSQALTAAAMRNQAANAAFDMLTAAGWAKEVKSSKKPDRNAVKMIKNGVESWIVPTNDDALPALASMAAMEPVTSNILTRAMNVASAMKRQAVTLPPSFLVTNTARGTTQNALMSTGANIGLKNNPITGFAESMKESWTAAGSVSARDFKRLSGMGDYRRGQMPTNFGRNDLLREMGLDVRGPGYWYRKALDSYETIGMATELMDRLAVFENQKANGVRPDEAAYQALNLMNYSRKGGWNTVRMTLSTMPFMNARIQGYSRIFEGATTKKGLTRSGKQALVGMALNGALYAAANVAVMAWNLGDEERAEKYKRLPLLRRVLGLNIVLPEEWQVMGIEVATIPHPFDIGFIFGAIPTAAMEQAYEVAGLTEDEYGNPLLNVTKAVAEQMFIANLMPQLFVPFMEAWTGDDNFTKRPIVSRSQANLDPDLQDRGADQFSKWLGQDLGLSTIDIPLIGAQSPVEIKNWIDELGGTAGMMLTSAFNLFAQGKGDVPDAPATMTGEGTGALIVDRAVRNFRVDTDLSRTKYGDEFYDAGAEIENRMASAESVLEAGGDVEDAVRRMGGSDYEALKGARSAYNKAKKYLSEIAAQERSVKDSLTLTPVEKRKQLVQLNTMRNTIVRNIAKGMQTVLGDGDY